MRLTKGVRAVELISKQFPPVGISRESGTQKKYLSASQQLMLDFGLMAHCGKGLYYLLPGAVRALDKLTALVEEEMGAVGGRKIQIPAVAEKKLWAKSGRWDSVDVLFKLKTRAGENWCLQPTCEESVSDLVSRFKTSISHKGLPLLLYQVTEKFRDEMHPKWGLLRTNSFLMKDLYSFNCDESSAETTYQRVLKAYKRIFDDHLSLTCYQVKAASGDMGGSVSHEFHVENSVGDDTIHFCDKCGTGQNSELFDSPETGDISCASCGGNIVPRKTVEVGHTFLLGNTYSSKLGAEFKLSDGKKPAPLFMGCYGIGLTRLLAAAVDSLSAGQAVLRWPKNIAPYRVLFIPPKRGSKEEFVTDGLWQVASSVESAIPGFKSEVVWDDRATTTVGKRLIEGRRFGYPVIVVGNKSLAFHDPPKYEVITSDSDKPELMSHKELFRFLPRYFD